MLVASEFPWAIFPAVGMSIGLWFHRYFGVRHGDEFMRRHQVEIERWGEPSSSLNGAAIDDGFVVSRREVDVLSLDPPIGWVEATRVSTRKAS